MEERFFNTMNDFLDEYKKSISNLYKLPLVLTNEDLKREFQISESTLNRLINLTDFPACWYGIRGHYSRDKIINWYRTDNDENFKEKKRLLRSL